MTARSASTSQPDGCQRRARLRARKTDGNEILLLSNMAAGHSGTPGRFGAIAENAQIMAWLLARAEQ